MLFENISLFICVLGALVGAVSIISWVVYVFEETRGVRVSNIGTYKKYVTLTYVTALIIMGVQLIFDSQCVYVAKQWLIIFGLLWVFVIFIYIVVSVLYSRALKMEYTFLNVTNVLLTVLTFWLVS